MVQLLSSIAAESETRIQLDIASDTHSIKASHCCSAMQILGALLDISHIGERDVDTVLLHG